MTGIFTKAARRLAAEVRERRRWVAFGTGDIRAYYGMDRMPSREEPISGGIVKCLDLAERFPNSPDKANLLYLVSSALPDRRELLASAARRAGGRFVLNQNGVAYPAWAGADWRKRNAPNARVHAMADYVVYQSQFCQRCAERFLGPRNGPSRILYNPVDTGYFSPREGYDRPVDSPVLLVAGSHHERYRVKTAIDALAVVRQNGLNAKLIVAGRLAWGEGAAAETREWAEARGLEDVVEARGAYSQNAAPELFRSSDVLVHLKVQDPCPRLAVEAMACGLPVVFSATGGMPELVGDEAGAGVSGEEDFKTIRPPSVEAVSEAVMRVLSDRVALARRARARAVQIFDAQDWIAAHVQIFESLVAGHSR